MKRWQVMGMVGMVLFLMAGLGVASEKAPQKIIDLANTTLAQLGADPAIVEAVKAENAKGKTLEAIKAADEKWMKTPGIDDTMKQMMASPCATRLREIQSGAPYYSEIFVMDNQGANVSMTDKTSDYWQGDEPKFTKSFNEGKGAVFVDDVKFDDSSQAYLVQISVPVKDGEVAIGAITFGIDVDKVK